MRAVADTTAMATNTATEDFFSRFHRPLEGFMCGRPGGCTPIVEVEGDCPECGAGADQALVRYGPVCDCGGVCLEHPPEIVEFCCGDCGAVTDPDPPEADCGQLGLF